MVSKGSSARVIVSLRSSGSTGKATSIPIETFSANKNMGRILLRRGGETVAAGRRMLRFQTPVQSADILWSGIVLKLLE